MNIVVQKFGGTSVSTPESREMVIKKVIDKLNSGYTPIIVVSAMGRLGAPYATDTLLGIVGGFDQSLAPRDKDILMSCGELLSAVLIAAMLNSKGYNARALTGFQAGIVTDCRHNNAQCLYVNTDYIKKLLEGNIIPVVAGFQGIADGIEITTLGRGGSDTTASILAKAYGAGSVEIYTDVDGIMTTDPRIVQNADIIRNMPYEEVYQMADHGAKVIHREAVDIVAGSGIPMKILNTFSDDQGTLISSRAVIHDPESRNDVISSVVLMNNRAQVTVNRVGKVQEQNILENLANNRISIDLINIFTDKIVFTIDSENKNKVKSMLDDMHVESSFIDECSKVTAVGSKMRGVPGVMARIFKALSSNGCEILQSADSHMNISCLVKASDAHKAVNAIHEEFDL